MGASDADSRTEFIGAAATVVRQGAMRTEAVLMTRSMAPTRPTECAKMYKKQKDRVCLSFVCARVVFGAKLKIKRKFVFS